MNQSVKMIQYRQSPNLVFSSQLPRGENLFCEPHYMITPCDLLFNHAFVIL